MTTIHLIRHGETVWNTEGRMQGHKDSPLTENGKSQAYKVREKINHIDVAYSSPSSRAFDTARIILQEKNKKIVKLSELKEINLGVWEGRKKQEIDVEFPEKQRLFWTMPSQFTIEGGETFTDLQHRSVRALDTILENEKDKQVLIVSHTATIKVLLAYIEKRPINKIWDPPYVGNGSHSIIEHTSTSGLKIHSYCGQTTW